MKNKIKCEICGKEMSKISAKHLKEHGLSLNDYKTLFPDVTVAVNNALEDNYPIKHKFNFDTRRLRNPLIFGLIISIIIGVLMFTPGIFDSGMSKEWSPETKTMTVLSKGDPTLTIQQLSHKPDLTTCEEVFKITSYVDYIIDEENIPKI